MKKLHIPDNYFAYGAAQSMKEIAKQLFQQSPIDFIDFTRAYYDYSWTFLTCDPDIYQYCINTGFIFLPYADITKAESFHYLAGSDRSQAMMADIKNYFLIDNVFAYVEKHDRYIDIYWYGSHINRGNTFHYYLNNLDQLRQYSHSFQERATPLIKKATKKSIKILSNLKNEYECTFENIRNIPNVALYSDLLRHLSPRERDCCQFIIEGLSAKSIAKKLNISFRTVESYLENIKNKLGCHSRYELISLLLKHSKK